MQHDTSATVSNPLAYLFRLAGNLATDWHRQRNRTVGHVAPEETLPCSQPLPDKALQSRQEFALLCAAIDELPPKCREAFLLYRGEGLSMREVAARLNIAERTVEHQIAKAMLHCRRRLREAGRAV